MIGQAVEKSRDRPALRGPKRSDPTVRRDRCIQRRSRAVVKVRRADRYIAQARRAEAAAIVGEARDFGKARIGCVGRRHLADTVILRIREVRAAMALLALPGW